MLTTFHPTKATGITVINRSRIKNRGNRRNFRANMTIKCMVFLIHFQPVSDLFPRYQCLKNTLLYQLVLPSLLALLAFTQPAGSLEWIAWQKTPQIALTFDDGPHPAPTEK